MEKKDEIDIDSLIGLEKAEKQKEQKIEINPNLISEKNTYDSRAKYIKLYEGEKGIDITNEIFKISESKKKVFFLFDIIYNFLLYFLGFSLGDYKCTTDFNLEDTMNSVEVNHYKMDPHYNYKEANTYRKLIRLNKIDPMKDLDLKKVNIFINIIITLLAKLIKINF
jgi:hypothetical protein